MFKIRYYTQTFEPKEFGRLIRFLNWMRYWLETLVQYLVLRYFLSQHKATSTDKKAALTAFSQDVKAEVKQWKQSGTIEQSILEMVAQSSHRQDDTRPKTLESSNMQRYLVEGREKKYAQRRLSVVPQDLTEDQTPESPEPELPSVEVDDP